MPASSPNLPHFLLELSRCILWLPKARMKIQQPWNRKVTWVIVQGHRRERKVHRNRVHKIKSARKLLQKSSRVNCRRSKSTIPWIQMRTMKNVKNEHGTSSNSQTIVPVLSLPQGPAASSQGAAASNNSEDEDSEYSDENCARSQDSERILFFPDLYVLTNDDRWTMTPVTHKYAAAAG